MEAKLIKDHDNYHLVNDEQFVIGTTDESILSCTDKYKLSLKNCQAIELGYDLDAIIENNTNEYITTNIRKFNYGFEKGFQKALEILGDKKFSEKDAKLAINLAWDDDNLSTLDIIQELQQNEWEVEIVEEDSKVVENHIWDGSNDGELTWKKQPLFDADGCLILKRK